MKTTGVDLGKGQILKFKTKATEMKALIDIGKTQSDLYFVPQEKNTTVKLALLVKLPINKR